MYTYYFVSLALVMFAYYLSIFSGFTRLLDCLYVLRCCWFELIAFDERKKTRLVRTGLVVIV